MPDMMNRRHLLRLGAGAITGLCSEKLHRVLGATESGYTSAVPGNAGLAVTERTIRFPKCRSLGWVQTSDDLNEMQEATGDVHIPAGRPATLIMFDEHLNAFEWLQDLRPDDLQRLFAWFSQGKIRLEHIAHLSGLQVMDFTFAQMGLCRPVANGLRGLLKSWCTGAEFGDGALEFISRCPRLWNLGLSDSRAVDGDFQSLAGPPSLKRLDLGFTNVRDEGLPDLRSFSSLKWMDLAATAISDARFEILRRDHPLLEISAPRVQIPAAAVDMDPDVPF